MFTEISDYSSHLMGLTDTSLRFLTKEGASGHPTILCILNRFLIDKSINNWYKNSGIEENVIPKLGDNVHWYKSKDNRVNFKTSVFESLLKYGVFFEENNSGELLNGCIFSFTTLNRKYFVYNSKLVSVDLNDENKTTESETFNEKIIDALSIGSTDFILTEKSLYSRKNKTNSNGNGEILFSRISNIDLDSSSTNKAMCSNYTNSIVIAGNYGGKLLSIGSNGSVSSYKDIKYFSLPIPEGSIIEISPSNNLPSNNNCTFCIKEKDTNNFLIGNNKTYGKFSFSSDNFMSSLDDGYSENSMTYEDKVMNFGNIQFCKTSVGVNINGKNYITKFEANYFNKISDFYVMYGENGFEILDQNSTVLLTNNNIKNIDYSVSLNGNIYLGNSSKVYKEIENNNLRIYTFNMNFDKEENADKIDVGNIKLSFMDLFNIASSDYYYSLYSEKIGILNNKNVTYAIGISENNGVTDFHLYGNDDRNRAAIEMKQCMEVFDMKA